MVITGTKEVGDSVTFVDETVVVVVAVVVVVVLVVDSGAVVVDARVLGVVVEVGVVAGSEVEVVGFLNRNGSCSRC